MGENEAEKAPSRGSPVASPPRSSTTQQRADSSRKFPGARPRRHRPLLLLLLFPSPLMSVERKGCSHTSTEILHSPKPLSNQSEPAGCSIYVGDHSSQTLREAPRPGFPPTNLQGPLALLGGYRKQRAIGVDSPTLVSWAWHTGTGDCVLHLQGGTQPPHPARSKPGQKTDSCASQLPLCSPSHLP